jgi:hypothetical protein
VSTALPDAEKVSVAVTVGLQVVEVKRPVGTLFGLCVHQHGSLGNLVAKFGWQKALRIRVE